MKKRTKTMKQKPKMLHSYDISPDMAGVILVSLDKKGRVEHISKKGCEVLGYKRSEIIGKDWFVNFLPKNIKTKVKKVFRNLMAGNLIASGFFENPVITKNGQERIILWHNNTRKSQGGKIIGTLSSGTDITKQQSVRAALQITKHRYQMLLRNIPQKIFYKYLNSVYVFCNESFASDLKIAPSDIKGKTDYDFFPKELAEKYRADDKQIKRSRMPQELEERYLKNGVETVVHTFKAPVKDEKDRIIGLFGVFWDITKRKSTENALAESKERYRMRFENSPISLWEEDFSEIKTYIDRLQAGGVKDIRKYFEEHPEDIADCTTMVKISDVNNATLRLYGAKNKSSFWGGLTRIFTKESYPAFKELLIALAEGKKPVSVNTVNKTLNGRKLFVNITTIVMPGYEKTWKKILRSIVDMTEAVQSRKKLEQVNTELRRANKKLSQLIMKDPSTGLYNHQYFKEAIEKEFYSAKRYTYPLSVIMLDIDYFKSINEVYGIVFGDLILKQLAALLKKLVRKYDIVIRYGGEEFVIISPRTNTSGATILAQRILDTITLYNFGNDKYAVKLKVSAGISSYPENPVIKATEMIKICEEMLGKGKEEGGNKVYSDIYFTENKTKKTAIDNNKTLETISLEKKISTLKKEASQSLIEAIFAFAKTIQLKDRSTGEHVERTVRYAKGIAEELGLSPEEVERIKKGAILHDLGKIGISENILRKKGKLTKKEIEEIKKHPQIGVDIIRPIQYLHEIIPLILFHHERWDGKGYPLGLKSEEIPMGARIISVADAYQAITSPRSYRNAFSPKKAFAMIRAAAGIKYDPHIVKIFLKVFSKEVS